MSITAPIDLDATPEIIEVSDIEILADDLTIVPDAVIVEDVNADRALIPFLVAGMLTLVVMLVLAGYLAL